MKVKCRVEWKSTRKHSTVASSFASNSLNYPNASPVKECNHFTHRSELPCLFQVVSHNQPDKFPLLLCNAKPMSWLLNRSVGSNSKLLEQEYRWLSALLLRSGRLSHTWSDHHLSDLFNLISKFSTTLSNFFYNFKFSVII